MNGLPERVQPGDLITADLMNGILTRLSTPLVINLGPLGAGTRTLVALGGGFEGTGGIWLDGVSLLPGQPARGINLVILDASLNLKFRQSYDTFGSGAASTDLINGLQRAIQYDVVAAVTADAYLSQLSADAKKALASVGGAALGNPGADTRASGAFIGVVPAQRANASFDYLTSVLPADGPGFGSATLTAPPFAWGIYSVPLKRFLMGGASASTAAAPAPKQKDTKEGKETKETKETKEIAKDTKETAKEITKENAKENAKEIAKEIAKENVKEVAKEIAKELETKTAVSDIGTKLAIENVTPINPGDLVTNPPNVVTPGDVIGNVVLPPATGVNLGGIVAQPPISTTTIPGNVAVSPAPGVIANPGAVAVSPATGVIANPGAVAVSPATGVIANPGAVAVSPGIAGVIASPGAVDISPGIAGAIAGTSPAITGGAIGNIGAVITREIDSQPSGKEAFIQPSERPDVGKAAVRASKGKANARRRRKSK